MRATLREKHAQHETSNVKQTARQGQQQEQQ